jgi:hypothetical protein
MTRTSRFRIAALLALVASGCATDGFTTIEPKVYAGVKEVRYERRVVLIPDTDMRTKAVGVYRVSEIGRTVEKMWKIRARGQARTLTEIEYGVIPEDFEQVIPADSAPKDLRPGIYAVASLVNPLGIWDYYYFKLEEGNRITTWDPAPTRFRGIALTEDGSP